MSAGAGRAVFDLSSGRGRGEGSVGLVGGEQGSIHRLHAGGAGEGSHQPVVYTVHVVDVHTWQEPDGVPVYKVQHTDHASEKEMRDLASLDVNPLRLKSKINIYCQYNEVQ